MSRPPSETNKIKTQCSSDRSKILSWKEIYG